MGTTATRSLARWVDRQAEQQASAAAYRPDRLRFRLRMAVLGFVGGLGLVAFRVATLTTGAYLGGLTVNYVLTALAMIAAVGAVLQLATMIRARRIWLAEPTNAGLTSRPGSLRPIRVS